MALFLHILPRILMVFFLVSSMLAVGLTTAPRAIFKPLRDLRLVITALALNFVAAPALAGLLSAIFVLHRPHAIGLMLLGCAPGAPFLPALAVKAGADAAISMALMTLLIFGSTFYLPLVLPWLLPGSEVNAWSIARPLLTLILAPMIAGIFLQSRVPSFGARWQPFLAKLGNLSVGLLFGWLVAAHFRGILSVVGSGAIGAAVLFVGGLFGAGYGLGGPRRELKGVLGLSCAARNVAVALGVSSNSFNDPEITLMILVCTVVILTFLYLAARWLHGLSPS